MTKTLRSPDSGKMYFLTLDADGLAEACTCQGYKYRGACKHQRMYDHEVIRATKFQALKNSLDVRSETQQAARRNAYCVEFSIY